jgi:hypothetical protein
MLTTVTSKNVKSITEMKEERNDLNKEALGKTESFQKYLKNTEKARGSSAKYDRLDEQM